MTALREWFTRARDEPLWMSAAVTGVAAVLLTVLAALHPELRFVDFISFGERAWRLREGLDWVNPKYPVGYPVLLTLLEWPLGDVLLAGKVLGVAAGAGLAWATARLVGPWGAAAVVCHLSVLIWGSTECTDVMAAAFAVGALAAAHNKHLWAAGLLAGAACMTRYTGIAVLPVVLVACGKQAWKPLLTWAACMVPHVVLALVFDRPLLPDQGENMAIGGRPPLWESLWHTLPHVARDWPTWPGLVGLIVGMVRLDKRAYWLAAYAALHLIGVSLAFANPRLVLPSTIAITAGVIWLFPRRWSLVPALAALGWGLPKAVGPMGEGAELIPVVTAAAELDGPFLSTTPWFYQRDGSWLRPALPIQEAQRDPRKLTPQAVHDFALREGFEHVVLTEGRVVHSTPQLKPLLQGEPAGWVVVDEGPGWRILRPL